MPDHPSLYPCQGSFRDSAGRVFLGDEQRIFRTIQKSFAPQWTAVEQSGFLEEALKRELLLPFKDVTPLRGSWKTLESPRLPFISYPYEWCFGQLKAAALLTLDLLDLALEHGCILRDATAYNVQFQGWRPVFIDLLSFEPWRKDRPWNAYLQFCRFFLAPLALMAKRDVACGRFLMDWVEGLPLDLASALLPPTTWFSISLGLHIHYHSRLQKKYADARKAASKVRKIHLSETAVPNLSKALRTAVEGLELPRSLKTEWGEYYADTNYTEKAATSKKRIVGEFVGRYSLMNGLAVDAGANTSAYSLFLAERFEHVLGIDYDYLAIEKLWRSLPECTVSNYLPLVIDLCNPSPAIGWNNEERISFRERCKADYLSVLAIIHHLVFTSGIPLPQLADAFCALLKPGGLLLLEFVPREDSQVERLLAVRKNVSTEYDLAACMAAFSTHFQALEQAPIDESKRTLLAFRKKG